MDAKKSPETKHDSASGHTGKKYIFGGVTTIVVASMFFGVLASTGFVKTMDWTNTEKFCISCHEMRINYDEYADTAHSKNRTGVVTTCPDCHVPNDFKSKLLAKLRASKDIYYHLLGSIDTKEKYENHRLEMAQTVWNMMRDTDSKTCRHCHTVESMAFEEQQGRAARKHKKMKENGKTCIDCHKGIAHELPEDYDESDE